MEYYVKSVISIIESNYHKLTSAEKTVADFFIHNNQNTDFSSSHIAELLYTSKATLSRFAKKIIHFYTAFNRVVKPSGITFGPGSYILEGGNPYDYQKHLFNR